MFQLQEGIRNSLEVKQTDASGDPFVTGRRVIMKAEPDIDIIPNNKST
jgi:hypothetical protein